MNNRLKDSRFMKNRCVCFCFLFAACFSFSINASAQNEKIVSEAFEPLIKDKSHVGIVVGVIDESGQKIFAYGSSGDANRKLDGDAVFEIGSMTKVFTSLLLADMSRRGEVSMTDPLSRYLPSSVKIPQFTEREITLLDLATHTSGLPEFPSNLKPKDESNPLADYTVADLYDFLSKYKLQRNIGTEYEYSSLGMGLLGHALALKAKTSYEDLVIKRICQPLGLQNTRITLNAGMRSRLVKGFDETGKPTSNWDLPTLAGAGALRSTAGDMLKFLAANLDPLGTDLAAILENAQIARHRAKSQKSAMFVALGWHVLNYKGEEIVWHDGGTGGYTSVICFNRKHRVGLVALSNSAEADDKSVLPKVGLQTLIKIISERK